MKDKKNTFEIVKVDYRYCDYLRKFDNKVPYNAGIKELRPFIGVLFYVGKIKYFVPLSSPKEKHKYLKGTMDLIKIDNGELGVINLNNMIPVGNQNYTIFDFNDKRISYIDDKRRKLLSKQLRYLNKDYSFIKNRAKIIYNLYAYNELSKSLMKRCCNFQLLEEKYLEYNNERKIEMYDIIIVGAGPAGLTAAIYALRANKKVLVLEGKTYGGQIVNAQRIDNYPGMPHISGFDFATNLYNQAKELGAEIKFEKVLKITKDKNVETNKETYKGKAIILATGAENRTLGLGNEENLIGKGISYCATCDGNFYKNKIVAVNGGGNTALSDALYLADIAKKVYLIHRRDTFKAELKLVEEVQEKDNIEFILNSTIKSINGEEKLESISIVDNDRCEKNIEINGLFVAIGQVPQNDIFSDVIEITSSGYIFSNDGVHTSMPGIYVAGDARVKDLRQIVTAVSDGAIAADTAVKEMK